jgi:hypothetical protein
MPGLMVWSRYGARARGPFAFASSSGERSTYPLGAGQNEEVEVVPPSDARSRSTYRCATLAGVAALVTL